MALHCCLKFGWKVRSLFPCINQSLDARVAREIFSAEFLEFLERCDSRGLLPAALPTIGRIIPSVLKEDLGDISQCNTLHIILKKTNVEKS